MTAAVGAARARRVRLPGLAIAAVLLLTIGVLTVAPTASTFLAQQRRIADTRERIAAQQRDLADLVAQRARWDDPAYVRAQAGSRLFYVMPGTTAYRVVGDAPSSSASASTAPAAREPWTAALLGSLVTAGTTDAAPAQLER